MSALLNTYRKSISILFLFSQLFLVSLTAIHYHTVEIQNGNYTVKNQGNLNAAFSFHSTDGLALICSVQQFSNSIYNLSYANYTANQFIFKNAIRTTYLFGDLKKENYNQNSLRAPPFSS